jgi:hypothetical protein
MLLRAEQPELRIFTRERMSRKRFPRNGFVREQEEMRTEMPFDRVETPRKFCRRFETDFLRPFFITLGSLSVIKYARNVSYAVNKFRVISNLK